MNPKDVLALVLGGEGQTIEFKECFPEVRKLAQKIAAFASSNAGTIILGVSDQRDIVGLSSDRANKALLISRIEGICATSIKPALTPSCEFVDVDGRSLLVIQVPKGRAPVYYVDNVPYIRHVTSARPADPQEVIDLVLAWNSAAEAAEPSAEEQFLGEVLQLIVDVVVHVSEVDVNDRMLKPWLYDLRAAFVEFADVARTLSREAPEDFADIVEPLKKMAAKLDESAHETLTMGSGWEEYIGAAKTAGDIASEIRQKWIDPLNQPDDLRDQMHSLAVKSAGQLSELAERAEVMADQNRLDDLQSEAGRIGLSLKRIVAFSPNADVASQFLTAREVGDALRAIETTTIYTDGGASERSLIEGVRAASSKLSEWLQPRE